MNREVKVGLTVMSAIAILYLSITAIRSSHLFSSAKQNYTILFRDVTGLKIGDPINVYGYPSGKVVDIRLESQGAVVEIALEQELTLRKDASALMRTSDLMGAKHIKLMPGESEQNLPSSEHIPGETALDLASASERIGDFLDDIETTNVEDVFKSMNHIAISLDRILQKMPPEEVGTTFHNLSEISGSLNTMMKDAKQRDLIGRVDKSMRSIDELMESTQSSMDNINELTEHLNETTVPEADAFVGEVRTFLKNSESLVNSLDEISEKLTDNKTLAGKLLNDEQLAADLEETFEEVDSLIDNANQTLDFVRNGRMRIQMEGFSLRDPEKKKRKKKQK